VTLELKDIEAIINLVKKNDLAVFKLEKDGFKLELGVHHLSTPAVTSALPPQVLTAIPHNPSGESANPSSASSAASADIAVYKEIVSPMVGTFYTAPSPDSAPYIQIGQEITADSVVCIIEAMKVMNEIKAEISGTIIEALVENGTAVQFGQALFRVK
jgi:acetyl-CoA carboxylase biotin carboxyl carrier protein